MFTPGFLFVSFVYGLSAFLAAACTGHQTNGTRHGNHSSASELLQKSLDAMGGLDALSKIEGITMRAPNIFRSQTLTQSYSLDHSDEFLATRGTQNISYSFASGVIQQAISREYSLSNYWIWSLPNLLPDVSFSLVVRDGDQPLALFRSGSNCLLNGPQTTALGYADNVLAEYLVSEARRTDPLLIYHIFSKGKAEYRHEAVLNKSFPAIYDSVSDVFVILDPKTFLPWIVRRHVYNSIFGHSVNDLYLTDYRAVDNHGMKLLLPHRRQVVYNDESVLEDSIFEAFVINPVFSNDTFSIDVTTDSAHKTPYDPHLLANFTTSDIGEFYETALWSGELSQNLEEVNATHPVEGTPQLWQLEFSDGRGGQSGYKQMVVEFERGVLVTDATAHLSEPVLKWIHDVLKKPIKYVFLSHHHHDHSYAVAKYVKAGAAVVVPEVAKQYWSKLEGAKIITYTDTEPFIVSDRNIQARGIWKPDAPHAQDWAWLVVAKRCPEETDKMAIFEADVWNPDNQGLRFDLGFARQWLRSLDEDGVRSDTVVVAAHGLTQPLGKLIDLLGYPYPQNNNDAFVPGGSLCLL